LFRQFTPSGRGKRKGGCQLTGSERPLAEGEDDKLRERLTEDAIDKGVGESLESSSFTGRALIIAGLGYEERKGGDRRE